MTLALALPLLLGPAPCAPPPAAQERRVELDGLTVDARYAWPDEAQGGYFPLRVELENGRAEEVDVALSARHLWGSGETRKAVRLSAGERLDVDLLGFGGAGRSGLHDVVVTVDGEEHFLSGLGPGAPSHPRQVVLAVARAPIAPARAEEWQAALGERAFRVGAAGFADLPARFEPYTSVDVVLLDAGAGLPAPAQLDALLRWARLGGTLALYGARAAEVARATPQLAAWAEPRFLQAADPDARAEAFALAHGRLLLIGAGEPCDGAAGAFLRGRLDREDPGWVPRGVPTRASRNRATDSPVGELPLRTLAAMLVLFAFVIGPVNFWFVSRSKRPSLLLVTVPGIALVASLALLGYGLLAQGLELRVQANVFTVLDQRAHVASTAEVRRLFAGGAQGAQRAGAGAACLPIDRDDDRFLSIDLTGGTALAADFLPVRRVEQQLVLADAPARARLALELGDGAGGAPRATNALGATARRLLVRDAAGAWHARLEPLADGAAAVLAPAGPDADELRAACAWAVRQTLALPDDALPSGAFYAELDAPVLAEEFGLEVERVGGSYRVIGVLDAGEERR